jgi:hypothetical protein
MNTFKDYLNQKPTALVQKAIQSGIRSPKDELRILQDPEASYLYALNVLRSPWPEAEPTIQKDPNFWRLYEARLLNKES